MDQKVPSVPIVQSFTYIFIILFLYVVGIILFVIAPIYSYLDSETYNDSYLEIAGTGGFVIANTMLLIRTILYRKDRSAIYYGYKIIIAVLFILGAGHFLSGAAYRLIDSKTLYNVYIDLTASICFTIGNSAQVFLYIKKSCHHKKTTIFKYVVRVLYFLGGLLFIISSIYRLFDYITKITLLIDIAAIFFFLIPNFMLFIRFMYRVFHPSPDAENDENIELSK